MSHPRNPVIAEPVAAVAADGRAAGPPPAASDGPGVA
jgi:hypothetical protein